MKKSKKLKIAICIVILASIVLALFVWWQLYRMPRQKAIAGFNAIVATIKEKNNDVELLMVGLQQAIDSQDKPLDNSVVAEATKAIEAAQKVLIRMPALPKDTASIIRAIEELNPNVDYSAQLTELKNATETLQKSIKQRKQVTNPKEDFVISRLKTIVGVLGIQAATEDNDPNKQLNKAGGYTAAVFFSHAKAKQRNEFWDSKESIIERATEGGGCIEVFSNEADANRRNDYLGNYDGGILSSGSHRVVGTCVIRTSHLLRASEQKELEANIIKALTDTE